MTKGCEACGGKGWITGMPVGIEREPTRKLLFIERCDLCERFDSDWDAAVEANRMLPGTLRAALTRNVKP